MKQLLKIETVPISFEFKVNHARIERAQGTAELEISRQKNGLQIKSRPIKLNIDTFDARNSITPSALESIKQFASDGKEGGYQATARFAQEGNLLGNISSNQDALGQIAASRVNALNGPKEFNITYLPSAPPVMDWTPGDLQVQYEMDKLSFDWSIEQSEFEFTPGNIEFSVSQMPDVIIEYMGGPLYVPPSADPNYVDMKA